MPRPQGCEKLHSPLGLVIFCAHITFLAVRFLENQTYSNDTVVQYPKSGGTSTLIAQLVSSFSLQSAGWLAAGPGELAGC